ncbi:MAG: tyrosine-type recombinase/integrase [Ardenticatenaceae bacterium]
MSSKIMLVSRQQEAEQKELQQRVVRLVLDSVDSLHTKRAYQRALDDFLAWHEHNGSPLLNKATVQSYRVELIEAGYSASSVNQRLSAIKKLAREAADNNLMDPAQLQGIENVAGAKRKGRRSGNWLTTEQAQQLLDAPDTSTLRGLRDRALLAVAIGCGLRRSEMVNLTFAHIQQREERWAIIDIVGKHQRVRSVPMPRWCKAAIDAWTIAAGISGHDYGYVFRPLHKSGVIIGDRIVSQTVHDVVSDYAKELGFGDLSPHDLRRTFAKLARKGGSELDQIKESLGHASVETTERYVGEMQDFQDAPADRLPLDIQP